MKSVPTFLSSLKQGNLASRTESVFVSESASDPFEISSELLIAVSRGLLVFPVIGYSKYAATRAAIETATSDLAQIGYWIRHHHGDPLNWHTAKGHQPEMAWPRWKYVAIMAEVHFARHARMTGIGSTP
jgi:hypothetical protein